MSWINKDIKYLFYPIPVTCGGEFFNFLKEELEGVDVDLGVFSGIYKIDGEFGWFEEKIVQGFEKDIRDRANPNGSWVEIRLKYLYSIDGESEFEKIFFNGDSLFGN